MQNMIKRDNWRILHQGLFWLALFLVLGLPLLWVFPLRGLIGTYYDNPEWRGNPVFERRDQRITLEVVSQQQDTFPQHDFSITWNGWIRIDREGEYRFTLQSDDGSSLVLDQSVTLIDNGGFHVTRKASGTMRLTTGLHAIQINYFQGKDAYDLKVFWTVSGQAETELPPQVLYPRPFPIRGIGFLTRHLPVLYPFSWLFLFLIFLIPKLRRHRNNLRGMLKPLAQNLALALFTILIMALLLEIGIRVVFSMRERRQDLQLLLKQSQETEFTDAKRTYSLMGIVQPSEYPGIVYELKPNLRGYFLDMPLFTNSRGLRDFEYSYQKPENTFRIVGLGDSSLFGWGVKVEETSLKVLERTLNQQPSPVQYQVLNFAAPGYNTAIEVEIFLQKCLKYAPDVVIMHFNTNDYDIPAFMLPPQKYVTFRTSYLLDFLYSRYQLLFDPEPQEVVPFVFDRTMRLEEADRLDEDPDFPEEYRYMVGEKGFLRAMERLVEATRSRNIPLLVYVVRSYPGLDPSYTPNRFRDQQLQLITRLSQEKGFFFFNMYPEYIAYLRAHPEQGSKVLWVTAEDAHPSAIAHQIEGEALYKFLRDNRLISLPHS